jgi:polar amino acid transport system substrate-binding protein
MFYENLKKQNKIVIFTLWFSLSCTFSLPAFAKDLKASIAIIPGHSEIGPDGKPRGVLIDLIKAIDEVYTDGNIIIELYPFSRSISNVVTGAADFHIPLAHPRNTDFVGLKNFKGLYVKNLYHELPFVYLSERVTKLYLVLYTNAAKPELTLDNIKNYDLAAMAGTNLFYKFKTKEVNSIESGIQMLLKEKIDGYVMEQEAVDAYLKANKITNIRRQLLCITDSSIIVAKSEKGKKTGRILTEALRKLKSSGKLQEIVKNFHQPYNDWQPYKK